jgi:hypothetical protein
MVQWLIDSGRAPDERMIADGVLGLAAHITGAPGAGASSMGETAPEAGVS